jgi:hypothetical protein
MPFGPDGETDRERLPLIGHAYDWPLEPLIFWNKLTGPRRAHRGLTTFIPSRRRWADVDPKVRIAFLGDVLPEQPKQFLIGESIARFLSGADYLVLNLEGVICERGGVLNAVRHDGAILDFLAELFPPERTIILCANNHAADCGREALERTFRSLTDAGFRIAGRHDKPSIRLPEGIQLSNGTEWLNVRRPYVPRLADADGAIDPDARFRVLCPHWGMEMMLYPSPRRIERARQLAGRWELIVGHHPHCPQPIAEENGRLVAYSLGNFAWGAAKESMGHGAALRVTVGPDAEGTWRLGESHWTFVAQTPEAGGRLQLDAAAACRFFPGVIATAV